MRVLFCCRPAHGHVRPLLPLAMACRDAGHEVLFGTGEAFVEQLRERGFRTERVGISIEEADRRALAMYPELNDLAREERWRFGVLLPHLDAVVHHCGSGIMLGALAHGLPQLTLPQGADQITNAGVLVDSGAGVRLLPEEVTAEAVAEAVQTSSPSPATARRRAPSARRSPACRRRRSWCRSWNACQGSDDRRSYAPGVAEQWGDDPKLRALLGDQGAAGFRALFDGFPEAVGVLWALRDADGQITDFAFGYGNPSMMRSFRVPAETRDRYTLLEALPRMRGSRAFDGYVRTCDDGEPWIREITYDTPFGDGYMLGTFAHRTAKLGDGVMVFLTDITEQRRMEAELRSYADVVAHDLREPVANMALLVRVLEQRPEQPPRPEVLQLLRDGIERSQGLIEAVLAYARLGELSREPVALDELMAQVADDLRPTLDGAGATLVVRELPEIDGDPRQLRRVLQNLVGNAVKFHGDAPPRVEVSALRRAEEWVVTVRDNGVGVDPGQATRIFGMFSRTDPEADGMGIGLAVCRRIVESHGGRIWVEPAEGAGSAFRFTMPL